MLMIISEKAASASGAAFLFVWFGQTLALGALLQCLRYFCILRISRIFRPMRFMKTYGMYTSSLTRLY
jgi:hypothetical protein